MSENHFTTALSRFTQEVANGGAIRHLVDLGYDAEEIKKHLSFPISTETLETFIRDYEAEQAQETASGGYTYVREYTPTGKVTFRKVKK